MGAELVILAAIVGYFCGSVSSARIIAKLHAPNVDISKIEYPIPGSDHIFHSNSVSASVIRMQMGPRFGVMTAIFDILKVAIPTLAFRLWQPDAPYYLIVAALGLVGHDWPIYHRFKGGRGESPIYGGLIVIDWLGALLMNLLGWAIGFVARNLLVLRWAAMVLLIPWFWLRTGSWPHLAYIVFANAIYWYTMSPELRQYFELGKTGIEPTQEQIAEFFGMGVRLGRTLDTYSWRAMLLRLVGRKPAQVTVRSSDEKG